MSSNGTGRGIVGGGAGVIKNGIVSGWPISGVEVSAGSLVSGVNATSNGRYGIVAYSSLLWDNVARGNTGHSSGGAGFFLSRSHLRHSVASDNGENGVDAEEGSSIVECSIRFNTFDGLELDTGSTAIGNTISINGAGGVQLPQNTVEGSLRGNQISFNTGSTVFGLFVDLGANLCDISSCP